MSITRRYLIYLSYIGTKYSGIQIQLPPRCPLAKDESTVGGLLQIALSQCNIINQPNVTLSSRTDQGVHALKTSVHVDLECLYDQLHPRFILTTVNKYFRANNHDIRVQEVRMVPNDFHARHYAKSRTYIYRFAVKKSDVPILDGFNPNLSIPSPLIETDRCYFIPNSTFDVEAVEAACKLFLGTNDVIGLMGNARRILQKKSVTTVRYLERLELKPGRPLMECPYTCFWDFWEVHCEGRSFVYKQVRRTVSILLAVAQGVMTLEEVRQIFVNPTIKHWWNVPLAPPGGLYLSNVKYDEEDFIMQDPNIGLKEQLESIDLKNFSGSIHERINLKNTVIELKKKLCNATSKEI